MPSFILTPAAFSYAEFGDAVSSAIADLTELLVADPLGSVCCTITLAFTSLGFFFQSRLLSQRRSCDASLAFQLLALANFCAWTFFGVVRNTPCIYLCNGPGIVGSLYIIFLIRNIRRSGLPEFGECAQRPSQGLSHHRSVDNSRYGTQREMPIAKGGRNNG